MSSTLAEYTIEANKPYYVITAQHDYDDGQVMAVLSVTQEGSPIIDPQDIVDYIKGLLNGSPDLLPAVANQLGLSSTPV